MFDHEQTEKRDASRREPLKQVLVYGLVSLLSWHPVLVQAAALDRAAPTVINNLAANALPRLAGSANGATLVETGDTLTINQLEDRIRLDWQSFNIGKDATVVFVQPDGSSVAFNRINDASRSLIDGVLRANGSVYLINNNGILFGANARVNVNSLIASTLNIDYQRFVKDKSYAKAIAEGLAAFEGGSNPDAAIELQGGARIRTEKGGSVFIFAPQITTETGSSIETPDGQTIMAAAKDQVFLAASLDPDLRGMLVEVKTGGTIDHAGSVLAERGNVSLVANAINQQGRLTATTSVDANGTIRLLARDGASITNFNISTATTENKLAKGVLFADERIATEMSGAPVPTASRTGRVTFTDGSVTEVVPDTATASKTAAYTLTDDRGVAVKNKGQPVSFVEVMGRTLDVERGASIVSRGGEVQLVATLNPAAPAATNAGGTNTRVTLHDGSLIDVSGVDTTLAMERNSLEVELRGDELKDSPLQRDNPKIKGQTVWVDIRNGEEIEFADISGYVAKVERTVAERLGEGGKVKIYSEGNVDFQKGAVVDLSGGVVNYNAGFVRESRLASGGQVYAISEADPNRRYDAVLQENERYDARWGVVERYRKSDLSAPLGTYVAAYQQGKSAGDLQIVANASNSMGTVIADVVTGVYQRNQSNAPKGGSLLLDFAYFTNSAQSVNLLADLESPAAQQQGNALNITVDQFRNSVDNVTIRTRLGDIRLAEDAHLQMDGGGSLSLTGKNVHIAGDITNQGGSISLSGRRAESGNLGSSSLVVEGSATLDTSGRWINDSVLAGGSGRESLLLDAGKITLASDDSLIVAEGARLRADGGAWLDAAGKIKGGRGGDVSVTPGTGSQHLPSVVQRYEGTASSLSLTKGGTFTLDMPGIRVAADQPAGTTADGVFVINPDFFQQGGFSAFSLGATSTGVDVNGDVNLLLQGQRYQFADAGYVRQGSASHLDGLVNVVESRDRRAHERAGVNLTLRSTQNDFGNRQADGIRIHEGAVVQTLPGGSITLSADKGNVDLMGSLIARGGSVSLGASHAGSLLNELPMVRLHDSGLIDVSATYVEKDPSKLGFPLYDYYDAGTVNINVKRGYILGEEGSRILADGLTAPLIYYNPATRQTVRESIALGAGQINLKASEGMLMDTSLSAKAASAQGLGGGLSVTMSSIRADRGIGNVNEELESRTLLQQDPLSIQVGEYGTLVTSDLFGTSNVRGFLKADSQRDTGVAYVDVDTVNDGGFARVNLVTLNEQDGGLPFQVPPTEIRFNTSKDLRAGAAITLQTPAIVTAGHDASVSAPYVSIGTALTKDTVVRAGTALAPNGSFTANADFIDLTGNITFRDARQVSLRSRGDIRLRGALADTNAREYPTGKLTTRGDVDLIASQIYTATGVTYTFDLPANGSIFRARHQAADFAGIRPEYSVFSAAGTLIVNADHILQQGVLKAPFGEIQLNGRSDVILDGGSRTSVSGEAQTVLFGSVSGDGAWLYPIDAGQPQLIDAPKEKSINVASPSIDHREGAQVDISGGGELLAYQFVPGRGGSRDVLGYGGSLGAAGASFAVVPTYGGQWAPYDVIENRQFPYAVGDTVRFSGVAGLNPDQAYAVLPAHYALLPGALLITPTNRPAYPGMVQTSLTGATIAAGKFGYAGTAQQDATWSAFIVEPGRVALTRSQYDLFAASRYFANVGVRPQDAGRVTYAGRSGADLAFLSIEGDLLASAGQGGVGGRLDIAARNIDVVNQKSGQQGRIELDANALSQLNVDSILLGGKRAISDSQETVLDVQADTVTVQQGAALGVSELLLAGKKNVTVESGASIQANRAGVTRGGVLAVEGDGALLQASVGDAVQVQRRNSNAVEGVLTIADGATVKGTGALALDSSRRSILAGDINSQGTMAFSSSKIALGSDNAVTGVALSQALLNGLDAKQIWLGSRSDIEILSDFSVHADSIRLDANAIRANGAAPVNGEFAARETITLTNTGSMSGEVAVPSSNSGSLSFVAPELRIEGRSGDTAATLALNGFETVRLQADNRIFATGNSALSMSADAVIGAGRITSAAGTDLQIRAAGDLDVRSTTTATTGGHDQGGIASRYVFAGDNVELNTRIQAASGVIAVDARNGIQLGEQAVLDVASAVVDFAGDRVAADAGSISLMTADGDIVTHQNTVLDVSSRQRSADSGSLILSAAGGDIQLNNTPVVQRFEQSTGGRVSVDAESADRVVNLMAQLQPFAETQSYRARNGDLVIGADTNVTARNIELVADAGAIAVAGTLDARSAEGGNIGLYARGDLQLTESARLLASATATSGKGGRVELSSSAGELRFDNGAVINVAGAGKNGSVRMFTGRRTEGVKLVDQGVQIQGADTITLYGMKSYQMSNVSQNILNQSIKADTDSFMNQMANQRAQLDGPFQNLLAQSGSVFEIAPGIDVFSTGDLTVSGAINLAVVTAQTDGSNETATNAWRYGMAKTPGYLSLRAAGDLRVNAEVSDGFVRTDGGYGMASVQSNPIADRSWDLNLVAGADIDSAKSTSVIRDGGDLKIAQNVDVRTGTGRIGLHAGGDVSMASGSAVYSGGRANMVDSGNGLIPEMGSFDLATIYALSIFGYQNPDTGMFANNRMFFGFGGGDVNVTALGSVSASGESVPHTHWLYRTNLVDGFDFISPSWGVNYDHFINGIGTLGGGNINVKAGGDIVNLTVSAPTTGMPTGVFETGHDGQSRETLLVRGGGDIDLQANGRVASTNVLISNGKLGIAAGGSIDAAPGNTLATNIAYGHADIEIVARGAINLSSVLEQSLVPVSLAQSTVFPEMFSDGEYRSFYLYDPAADSLTARSLSGDILIAPKAGHHEDYLTDGAMLGQLSRIVPSRLRLEAMEGSIHFTGNGVDILPHVDSSLTLYAGNSIVGQNAILRMSGRAANLPDVTNHYWFTGQAQSSGLSDSFIDAFALTRENSTTSEAYLDFASTDPVRIVARTGDIAVADPTGVSFYLPRAADIIAGRDIRNTQVRLTHSDDDQVSVISAGRDFIVETRRDPDTGALNVSANNTPQINMAGPGTLLVTAGRDISLGSSGGIVSTGDLYNPLLPDAGADLLVAAGISSAPDFARFADRYMLGGDERGALTSFLLATAALLDQDMAQTFNAMSRPEQIAFAQAHYRTADSRKQTVIAYNTLLNEVRRGGFESTNKNSVAAFDSAIDGYQRGYTAIATLFDPALDWQGDLSLVFSTINTRDGGDIGIIAPGGSVDVGLPISLPGFSKTPEQLGIITTRSGDLKVFADQSVNVNQSRTFALAGDIMMWSSNGDIDAGRGSKTAAGLSRPIIFVDETGRVVVDRSASIAGSGIRGSGKVELFAPSGIIDAGEAGIGAGGDLVLGANAVVGADNIDVGGVSIGVPTNTGVSSSVAAAGSLGAAASSASMGEAVEQAETVNEESRQVAFLTVEIIGLGD